MPQINPCGATTVPMSGQCVPISSLPVGNAGQPPGFWENLMGMMAFGHVSPVMIGVGALALVAAILIFSDGKK